MFKKILLAYDGSECAQQAAHYATELAKQFGGKVTVLYAFHPVPRGWNAKLAREAREADIIQGDASVSAVVEKMHQAGVHAEGVVVEGIAADVIVKHARANKNDAIVIGSLGPAPAHAFLLGRVSERVAYAARCPVLIVR